MAKVKLAAALVLALLVIILVLQNTEQVETKFLFITVEMPRAALLALTMLIGIATGFLASLALTARRAKKSEPPAPKDAGRI
jgi:lipopolysaccharide assembly protein A